MALTLPVYPLLGRDTPLFWPRSSATLVDNRSSRILQKYGRTLGDLFAGSDEVLRNLEEELPAAKTALEIRRLSEEVRGKLSHLQSALPEEDANLVTHIDTSRSKMLYQLSKLEERLSAGFSFRREAMARHIHRVCDSLAPAGDLQEARLAGIHFLLRHPIDLLRFLYGAIDIWKFEHQLIPVD